MTDTSHSDNSTLDTSNTSGEHALDYEALAREMGWRSKEEFKGDDTHFVDAKTFYERGVTVLPIVRAENKALRDEMERIKADAKAALQVAEKSREREVAELQAQLEAAKAERKEAISSSDGERYEASEERVKELQEAIDATKTAKPKSNEPPPLDPQYIAWRDKPENAWFKNDEEAQAIADGLVRLPKYRPLYDTREKLWDAVVGDIKKLRAAQREEQRKDLDRPGPEGGGRGNAEVRVRAGEKSFANLTPEFQKQCDRQYRDFGITIPLEKWRERYVKEIAPDAFRK